MLDFVAFSIVVEIIVFALVADVDGNAVVLGGNPTRNFDFA